MQRGNLPLWTAPAPPEELFLFARSSHVHSNAFSLEVRTPSLPWSRRAQAQGGWENLGTLACHWSMTVSLPNEPNKCQLKCQGMRFPLRRMTVDGDFQLTPSDRVLEIHIQSLYLLVWGDGVENTSLLQMRKLKLRSITAPVQGHSTHCKSKTKELCSLLCRSDGFGGGLWA